MIKNISRIAGFMALAVLMFASCKKTEITIPPEQAHFTNLASGSYFITGPTVTYKIPVGVTTVSNVDRNFAFNVSSPTGAVQGTHYTLNKTVATIKAGQAIDSIEVRGILAQYTSGRKDTLVFTITEGGKSSQYNQTFTLLMRGPCFEGDVDLDALRGTYTKTTETFGTGAPYGPYVTTISAVNKLTATTGTITVTNIWDNGWGPITFLLDWTNPTARTAVPIAQTAIPGSNAGDLNATYNGQTIAVRPFANNPGTFSACNGTFTLRMQLGVTNLGFFAGLYTVNMAR
jgi:hypothetical protein